MAKVDLRDKMKKARVGSQDTPDEIPASNSLHVLGQQNLLEQLETASATIPVREIEIERLLDNPYQNLSRPVVDEDGLEELAGSIRQNGFYGALLARLQPGSTDQYELAYGHRRRDAAKRAGLTTLPVKVLELTDNQMARVMASENFSREDLTPVGEANVVGLLYANQNMPAREIAEVIGKSKKWVDLRVNLFEAPEDLKDLVRHKPDTLSLIPYLVQVHDPKMRANLVQAIVENRMNRNQLIVRVNLLKSAESARKLGAFYNAEDEIVKGVTNFPPWENGEENHNLISNTTIQPKVSVSLSRQVRNRWKEKLARLKDATEALEQLHEEAGEPLQSEAQELAGLIKRLEKLLD